MPQRVDARGPAPDAGLQAVLAAVRRVVGAARFDPATTDDLVQEALVRVVPRTDLEPEVLLAYAVVVARNTVRSHARHLERRRRLEPRLADVRTPDSPEEVAVGRLEHGALARALAHLPEEDRRLLLARDVDDRPATAMASEAGTSPGALAVRLTRARARLRLEFLLAARAVELPTARCRPVLLALSSGERRRQVALAAGDHLRSCPTCQSLSEPLLTRRRSLANLWPLLPPAAATGWLQRRWRHRPGQVSAAAASVVVAAVVALLALAPGGRPDPPPAARVDPTTPAPAAAPSGGAAPAAPPPAPPPLACGGRLLVDGRPVAVGDVAPPPSATGLPAEVAAVPTTDVPLDEGFWLGCDEGRLWVALTGEGESPAAITPGTPVSFQGRVVPHGPGYAAEVGLPPSRGAEELSRAGVHLEADVRSVRSP